MERSRYYNMQGEPIDLAEWCLLMEDGPGRTVAKTERDGVTVSTVLLGLDHSFGDGPPLIFETMIFGRDEDDEYQVRYSTRADAEAGHEQACAEAFGATA